MPLLDIAEALLEILLYNVALRPVYNKIQNVKYHSKSILIINIFRVICNIKAYD